MKRDKRFDLSIKFEVSGFIRSQYVIRGKKFFLQNLVVWGS